MPDILLYTITLGFLAGVIVPENSIFGCIVGLILFSGIIYFGFLGKFLSKKVLLAGLIFLSAFGFGIVRYELNIVPLPVQFESNINKQVQIQGVVADDPDIGGGKTIVIIRIGHIGVRATIRTDESITYNDTVTISGTLVRPQNFQTSQGTEFDYISYLSKDSIFYVIPNATLVSHQTDTRFSLARTLFNFRHKVEEKLFDSMPARESGFIAGILLGTKTDIDPALRDALVTTGTVHMIALSGYNVSVVADGIAQALKTFLPQIFASLIGGIGIILFVIMTGASSTAIRAGLMALLLLFARVVGRPVTAIRVLAFAAIALVMINPSYLISDVSFQLSFLATLGLLLISPVYVKWFQKYLPRSLAELVGATLAAETMVTPFIIYKMGIFSLVSLPVNIIILPFVPLLMFAGFVLICSAFVSAFFGTLFGYPVYLFAHAIIAVIEKAAVLPMASITITNTPLLVISIFYALTLFTFIRLNLTNIEK